MLRSVATTDLHHPLGSFRIICVPVRLSVMVIQYKSILESTDLLCAYTAGTDMH